MARMLFFKRRAKKFLMSDYVLIRLVSEIINKNPKYQNIEKGVWVWNRTDHRFSCSLSFCEVMNIPPWTIPDLDLWIKILSSNDLINFVDLMEGVLNDSKPRNCILELSMPDARRKIIQCFLETKTYPNNKNYVIGVFCDVTEIIFSHRKN